ncbi:MAG: 3'-5' exonuclease [Lachnospiraceae bacterium]|nr:3'-5' exonuclease [Lachnospiraceae bacterium]
MTDSFVAVDIETTGLNPATERIIEIGAVRVRENQITETFDILINPGRILSSFIIELTGITDEMLAGAADTKTALSEFLEFIGEDVLLGHHISFDYSFLKKNIVNAGGSFERLGIDTLKIARAVLPELEKRSLEHLCRYYHIYNAHAHRACDDARATAELYLRMKQDFYGKSEETDKLFKPLPLVCQVKKESPVTAAQIRYLRALLEYHKLDLGIEPESLTKSEASRHIDKIILNYGRISGKD